MAHGGVEVVIPNELHRAAAEPDAFRIAGWSVDGAGRFGELLDLALAIIDHCRGTGRFAGWVRSLAVALSEGSSHAKKSDEPGNGETARNCSLKIKYSPPHEFPDYCLFGHFALNPLRDADEMGLQCGKQVNPMAGIANFVQQVTTWRLVWYDS